MSKRDTFLLIDDMQEAGQKILRYTSELSFYEFLSDDKTIDAVIRNFEIIGEAANRIDDDFKINNPHVEWDRLRGFRNRIVHEYFGVDYEIVWSIIQHDLPQLIETLSALKR
jgi:uncharacterized protein with HEPN domain